MPRAVADARVLQARSLSRSFGSRRALVDVSFDVAAGEIVALLGPNGAGKSTLLQILAGVVTPTSGTATVAGHELPRDARRVGRVVGYVPQGDSLYPELTVRESVRFFATAQGVARRDLDARVAAALEEARIAHRADDRVGALSGGLRQRAALAASLVHEPKVLLLDEPETGLDPLAQERLREVLARARESGRAVLVSSHSVAAAGSFADRVGLLVGGRLEGLVPASEAGSFTERFRMLEAGA